MKKNLTLNFPDIIIEALKPHFLVNYRILHFTKLSTDTRRNAKNSKPLSTNENKVKN